jgi:hypothetical protein
MDVSNWAAPISPVVKPDGSIRICGDYRLTINQAVRIDAHPIPCIEDLFASLSGGENSQKLNIVHAYLQMNLNESSKQFVTVNTHKGLFCYQRLPFRISSAPAIFQHKMESVLKGIPHVCVYIDDILITGSNHAEHLSTLQEVLSRLENHGVCLKKAKWVLSEASSCSEYLGHQISAQGIQPTNSKVEAIKGAPTPKNATELRAFLGMVSYYTQSFWRICQCWWRPWMAPVGGRRACSSVWCSKISSAVFHTAGPLWPSETTYSRMWCFACWNWSKSITRWRKEVFDQLLLPVGHCPQLRITTHSSIERESL